MVVNLASTTAPERAAVIADPFFRCNPLCNAILSSKRASIEIPRGNANVRSSSVAACSLSPEAIQMSAAQSKSDAEPINAPTTGGLLSRSFGKIGPVQS